MTTVSDSNADSRSGLTLEIERLTKELQSSAGDGSSNPAQILLQRARVYADLGDESNAQSDISQAAALVKDAKYASADNVAAVERAFREITVSRKAGTGGPVGSNAKYADKSIDDLVAIVVEDARKGASDADATEAMGVLESRIRQKKQALLADQLAQLVNAFHSCVTDASEDGEKFARALADCISASINLAADSADKHTLLGGTSEQILNAWETHESDGQFKQQACRYGTGIYASMAFALAKRPDESEDSSASSPHDKIYQFFISQVWMVGTLPVATSAEVREVVQGALRLLTADRPMFIRQFVSAAPSFVRLLDMLGQKEEAVRSLALLFASQLLSAACDPMNSLQFPGFDTKAARASATQKTPPPALLQVRALVTRTLDTWIQSTAQAERSRGLRALAGLYEAGVGADVSAELWLKDGWVEELWDQGEFDKLETQLALLHLADASSADAKISGLMKKTGNGLVQELVRKGKKSKDGSMEKELADTAAVVLSKWTGVSAAPAGPSAPAAGTASGIVEIPDADDVAEDADPRALADMHAKRITELASQGASDANTTAIQRAAEALGYLCLKPELKQHVSQNSDLLRALFSYAQKSSIAALKFSATMLVRNLTQYRPVLSEEQKRVQQLQKLSSRAQQTQKKEKETVSDVIADDEESKWDSAEHVSERSVAVCKAGCLAMLVSAVQPAARPSESLKDAVAEVMVSLATTQALRGLLVQQGGVRALLSILTADAPKAAKQTSETSKSSAMPQAMRQQRDRNIAFALAKIAISVPPHLAFQDPREIVRLLLALLAEESETQALLMKFEALLALTNLASAQPGSAHDVRGYMANDLNGMSLIEMVVLSDHVMVRRAATELVCNLVYDQGVFERFVKGADKCVPPESAQTAEVLGEREPSGIVEIEDDDDVDAVDDKSRDEAYRSQRLHLLVALADVDDTATRSAAAGALAVLSNDARCCRYLFLAHPRASDVLLELTSGEDIDEVVAFRHRVAVVWANAANCGDTRVLSFLRSKPEIVGLLKKMAAEQEMPYVGAAKSALARLQ
ncbi:SWI5-dependent HO expression protein 4 [Coemansia erecta]|uniref:SWI5-dependent HO expression protein 4 n=1 Tax=Coemansia erecta TaxID=147472 RepID=A0A9W7XXS3_9FUNG|nr:SWI5-dependent HO expression protein 4 [Coemansia erecta]